MIALATMFLAAQVTGSPVGLDMVPTECRADDGRTIPTDDIILFRNRIVSFNLGNVTLRSEVIGNRVHVRYSDEDGTAFFNIGSLIRYQATDLRLYHGTLDGRPVLFWEEVVENVTGRGGIIEYRGRGMFSLCDGRIHAIDHRPYLAR